jgi:hypothetical protein
MPSVPGATVININDAGELRVALESFAGMASGPATGPELPPGTWETTALLYFTGGGITEASVSKLVIDDGPGTANVDPAWLTARLNSFSNCHVNVVAQQSFSGGLLSALTGSTLTQWSFTYACSDTQDSYGNNTLGSFFTHGWLRGLNLETLPAGTPDAGKYADELGSVTEAANRKVSLEEAMEFGKQIHDSMGFGPLSTPDYDGFGGSQYPGLPEFVIRDGAPAYWWESPDIYLTHPNHGYLPSGDLYIPDPATATPPYNNTINRDVRNIGTHPVRAYSIAAELYKFGAGPTSVQHTACDIVPSGGILLPIDVTDIGTSDDKTETYEWNTPFYEPATHNCVKAEAKLLCSDVDFTWSVPTYDFEGQRNIDEMTVVPPPPLPIPFPNLQGFKEHIYGIQNRFDEPRKFIMVFPEKYQEYQDVIELTWFEVARVRKSERIPLDVVDEPVLHIPFSLKAGEKTDILLQVKMKPDFAIEDGIILPFEILVKGTVLDKENKPVAEAKIFIRTVNDLQGAVITTDKKGLYAFPDINPDVYYIHAETENCHSKEQTVVLLKGKEEELKLHLTEEIPVTGKHVKVVLDKIRIMDDHDSCIKGKGELTFTSVIVPDNDDSRKQVTRLPAKGVYHVSDKPGENEIRLEVTLFDGIVTNRFLSISISGKEIDVFDPDDDTDTWCGQYYPSDEYIDREDVGDWALWYRIIRD